MRSMPSERDRLAENYRTLLDGELIKLSRQSYELTEEARTLLAEEIQRRGLDPNAELPEDASIEIAPEFEEKLEDLVVLRKFRDFPEAMIAKGSLDSAGIGCFLLDENIIRMDWFYSQLLGGLKLAVRQGDAEAALEVLQQPIPDQFEVDGVGNFEQPRCPECSSVEVIFEGIHKSLAVASAWAIAPIVIPDNRWRCESCGHRWIDSGTDTA